MIFFMFYWYELIKFNWINMKCRIVPKKCFEIRKNANSAYKVTPLEGIDLAGPLKNAQPGFYCIDFL